MMYKFLCSCFFFSSFFFEQGVSVIKIFTLCSPLKRPSPQLSGNSSEETLPFRARCVKNYVHWPAMQEWSRGWTEGTEGNKLGQGEAGRHGRAGNRPSSERIKRHRLSRKEKKRRTREMHTSRRGHAVKRREGGEKLVFGEICSSANSVDLWRESREGPSFCRLQHGRTGLLVAHI